MCAARGRASLLPLRNCRFNCPSASLPPSLPPLPKLNLSAFFPCLLSLKSHHFTLLLLLLFRPSLSSSSSSPVFKGKLRVGIGREGGRKRRKLPFEKDPIKFFLPPPFLPSPPRLLRFLFLSWKPPSRVMIENQGVG